MKIEPNNCDPLNDKGVNVNYRNINEPHGLMKVSKVIDYMKNKQHGTNL